MNSELIKYAGYAAKANLSREEAEEMHADIVLHLLIRTIKGLRSELDPAAFINAGWGEVESFVEALCNGGRDSALLQWQAKLAAGGHPKPSSREFYARRAAVLMCAALAKCKELEKGERGKMAARRFAARQLERVFDPPPTDRAIEGWQRAYGPLSFDDELLVSTAFATAGGQPQGIAIFFVALCRLAIDPSASIVREGGSAKPPGYKRNRSGA